MKPICAWMLTAILATILVTGCQEKTDEAVALAPDQEEPLQPFPEDQVPIADPQPEASPPVDTSIPPVETTVKTTEREPVITPKPAPKENYAPPEKKNVRHYVVRKGDTLQKISKKFFGTTKKWRAIYKANRKALAKGPDKIHPGMKLVIP